jgi:hypothetical protein
MKRQHKRLVMDPSIREARLNLRNIERADSHVAAIDHSRSKHSKPSWIGLRAPTNDFGEINKLEKEGYKRVKYERYAITISAWLSSTSN